MTIRNAVFVGLGLAVAAGVAFVGMHAAGSRAAEMPADAFLQEARRGSIERVTIVGDRASAVIDGKERFAVIPRTDLDFVAKLARAGVNVDNKRRG
jgi:hypothetical protein